MSKKSIFTVLILAVILVAGFFVWRSQDQKAKAARMESEILKGLSSDELVTIFKSRGAEANVVTETKETRQAFLKGMREYLALASQARREGFADDPNFKRNFEYKKRILLADMYAAKLAKDNGSPYTVPEQEIQAVWVSPENENRFKSEMSAIRSVQLEVARQRGHDEATVPELAGGSLAKARLNWARTKLMSDKAIADGEFMSRPEVPLRIRILEAGVLSSDYLRKNWKETIKASDKDIADYLAIHPELDVLKKKEKALSILQRVKAGEDFAKLANEFSEDRSSKKDGGLYKDVRKDMLWIEVENAALSLENGQIADRLVESNTGYHIVKLDKKQVVKDKNGSESVIFNVRHILLQRNFEDPTHSNPEIPATFLTPLEIATAEIEKEKRNRFVDSLIKANQVNLPEDFSIN